MTRLKCSKCGKVFDKKAIVDYGAVGVTGGKVGVSYSLLVWPFTMRVYAACPVCNEKVCLRFFLHGKRMKSVNCARACFAI